MINNYSILEIALSRTQSVPTVTSKAAAAEQEEEEGVGMKTVCVTGGSGYIASWLVKFLLRRGYTVKASVRDTSSVTLSPSRSSYHFVIWAFIY